MLPGLDAAELPADAVEVGRIADAWGIQGWFKVVPYSAVPEALFSSKRWFLMPPEQAAARPQGTRPAPAASAKLLSIKQAREHSSSVVASAHAVPDRAAAEALRGARIFVARSSFPTAATDEYYWVDLIGLQVLNRDGLDLGRVRELLATGPQTVLVIDGDNQGEACERMIPFVAAYVDAVDLPGRRITVDWQPDY